MYCDTNQLPTLLFCGSHPKPHGARGLGKNYHLHFDPNLGNGIYAIRRIPCACVACTSMLDKPCISGIQSTKEARYQPITNFNYWPVLGEYYNRTIIDLTPKSIAFEAFDEMYKVVFNVISENMASLVQLGMYGAINIADNT